MRKCPKCGYSPAKETFHQMMDRVLKEVRIKQEKELGYGVPESEADLGSCITGEWRQYDDQKESKKRSWKQS